MNTLDYYEYAKLSTAAYVDMDKYNGTFTDVQFAAEANSEEQQRLPGPLANHTFVFNPESNQTPWVIPTGGYIGNDASGFAATLFQRGTEKVLAIRGTEPDFENFSTDLVEADLQHLGEYGMAIGQAVSLYNFVQRLMAPGSQSDVIQLQLHVSLIPPNPSEVSGDFVTVPSFPPQFVWVTKHYNGQGLGELLKNGEQAVITGHSLGGHLAAIGARLFPNVFSSAVTFNAPGYDPALGVSNLLGIDFITSGAALTDELIDTLFAPHLAETPLPGFSDRVITIESEDAISGDDYDGISGDLTGQAFSDEQYVTTEKVTHDIGHLMDGLAVQSLLYRMNDSLSLEQSGEIVAAITSQTGKSYELIVEKLHQQLIGEDVQIDQTEPGDLMLDGGDIQARRTYYSALVEVEKAIKNNTALHLESLVGKSVSDILTIASGSDARATRYALRELSPFIIVGVDYQSLHNADGALDLYDTSTGQGELTERWIADRSAHLAWLTIANKEDKNLLLGSEYGYSDFRNWDFVDLTTGRTITLKGQILTDPANKTVFGTVAGNTILGGIREDYLYGMAGDDTLLGDGGNDYLEGGVGHDSLIGGTGADQLIGGAGADILDGGSGNDLIHGGTGIDTYQFSGSFGKDTLVDIDGLGRIQIEGINIGTATAAGRANQWSFDLGSGVYAGLAVYDDARSSTGKRLVIVKGTDTANTITVDNFDLTRGLGVDGYLGIKLDPTPRLALKESGGTNVWNDPAFSLASLEGQVSSLAEGTGKTFTLYLNQAARAGETITLALSDLADKFNAILGDTTVAANGAVITLVEGQTQVAFALVQTGDVSSSANIQISATYTGENRSAVSNGWGIDLQDSGTVTYKFNGDQRAKLDGIEIDAGIITPSSPSYGTYYWGATSWALDGTLTGGLAAPDFSDVISGSHLNDSISGLGGNDALFGDYGNDTIYGGDGSDLIAGAEGSDSISGGDGDDFITGSGSLYVPQRKSPTEDIWSPPAGQEVFAQGVGWGIYGYSSDGPFIWSHTYLFSIEDGGGDFVDGGSGNDHIVGGGGADYIKGGTGDDVITSLGSNDVIDGGDGDDLIWADGLVNNETDYTFKPFRPGADFVDGGTGNDTLLGGGENDVIYGGLDNDSMWGDDRGVTSGATYLALTYHGNDYMDGEDGNDYLEGGGKNDTLYGGAGIDTLWGDTAATNIASPSHNTLVWGNDYLDGEEGNDYLFGGGKDDTLYGGIGNDSLVGDELSNALEGEFNGNDYLDGGTGDDSLTGGGRNDTLYGGQGNDTLLGDDILSRVSIEFHGDDYLDGGEGDDLLNGDGGNDILYGGAGNDTLLGDEILSHISIEFHGDDYLDGGEGNDVLFGDGGNDVLIASAGQDWLDGGEGNDQYVIDLDPLRAPSVTIGDSGISDNDVVEITSHRLQDISTVQTATNGIQISFSDGTFIGIIDGARGSISTYQFADASLNWQKFVSTYLQTPITLAGNDIAGGMGDDTLTAQNSVQGGKGNDEIYIFNTTEILLSRGDGADLVITSTSGNENTVKFLDGINPQDLLVSEYVNGAGESVLKIAYTAVDYLEVINGWAGFIESYRFSNGETLNHSDLISRIGARTIFGTASADAINGGLHDDLLVGRAGNDNIAAGAGNDTLEGGMGSDTLTGGTGSDVYHFEYGGGHDVIVDGGTDVNSIKLLGTLKADELITERIENHLVVTIDSTGDSMTISGYFDAPSSWMIVDSSGQQTAIEDVRRVGVPVQNETIEQKATREYVRYTEREHARGLMAYGYNPVGKNKFQRVENYRFTAPSGLVTESLTYSTISISHLTEAIESGGSQYIEMHDYSSSSQSTVKNSAFFDSTIRKTAGTDLSQRFVPIEDFIPASASGRSISFDSAIPVWGNQTRIENNFPVAKPGVIGFVTNTPPDPQGMKAIPGVSFRESYHNETYQTKTIEVSPSGNMQNRVTYSGPGSILGSAEDDHIAPEDRRTSIIEETAVGVFLSGRAGDDTLVGSAYSDHLFGGEGKNVLIGNTGGDTYYVSRSSDGDIIMDSHQGYLYLTERDDYAEILVDEDDTISFEDGITFDELDLSWQHYSPLDASAWEEDWGGTISFFANFMDFNLDGRSLVSSATPLNVGLQFPRISNPADFFNSGDYLAAETAWGGESSFTFLGNFQQLMQNNHAIFREGIENLRFSDGIEFDLSDVLRYMPDQSALVADSFLQHDDELYIGGLSSSATVSINNQGPLPTWLTLEDGVLSGDIPIDYAGTIVLDLAAYEDVGIGLLNRSYTIRILNPGLVHEGTETAELVQGTGREDSLSGGLGNDTLIGMSGIDEIKGGIGDDLLIGDLLTNEVFSALGTLHSSLAGHVQQSTAAPSSYNTLYGGAGNDTLVGAATGDYLDGGSGADYLIGGAGSDRLLGDSGDDVYFFRSGDGHDLILEYATSGSFDTIRFGEGITSDTIVFSTPTGSSNDLVITYGTGDSITLVNALKDERFNVERIEFDASPQWVIDLTNPTSPVWIAQPGGLNGTSGDDTIVGGTGGDLISGGLGNDWLDGGLGDDTLIGGAGDDVYGVDSALDVVTENAGEGTDTVQSSVSYALGANVENLTLTGTAAINATGNLLNNVLTGNSAANVLDGGAGADTMTGGLGDDTYVVDSSSDVVIENASAGADTVQSSVTFTLGANLENLTLTGSANVNGTGNNDHNSLTGNGGNNILSGGTGYDYLFGGAGDDTLDGGSEDDYLRGESGNDVLIGGAGFDVLNGGEGADTMSGGADDDRYIVDNVGDVIIESADDGTLDWVESYVSYTLSENVEELILLHPGGAINGTGNSLDNYLQGNSSANVLDGGAGADTMYGAAGDDTYVVDSAADMVIEVGATASSSGTDTVNASISYTLGSRLENLTLTGSASINATGNSLNNVLTGNSAANVLDGGAGADTMTGGLGDDTYVVDSSSDVVIENASAGIDTVQSSVTFTLGSDVEKLVLTGTAATEGRGNALENVLSGNSAANTLYGDAAGTSGNTAPLTSLSVFARGSIALGAAPIMEVWIDGVKAQTFEVSSTTTQEYVISAANLPVTAAHRVDVVFTNDAYDGATGQDRNLYVERLRFNGRDYLTNTDQLLLDYGTGAGARDGMNITLATSGVIATNAALRFSLDGSDRLDGGAGADTLIGGTGDDMYYVDNASDSVVELSGQGLDTVKSSVSHTLAGNVENLVLTGSAIAGTGNDLANLIIGNAGNNILNGGGSTDSLRGGAGADTLIGGLGNDLLDGGAGNDTYLFSRGHGQDSVWESDTTVGNQDVMSFDSTVAYDQLWLKRVGNNLEVSVIGTTDKITVSNWYVGNQWHVEQVAASDKILVDTQVQALVDAMAAMTPPPLGQTALSAAQVSALQPVLASSWQ